MKIATLPPTTAAIDGRILLLIGLRPKDVAPRGPTARVEGQNPTDDHRVTRDRPLTLPNLLSFDSARESPRNTAPSTWPGEIDAD